MSTVNESNTGAQDQPVNALLASQKTQSFGEYVGDYLRRLRAGDLGSLPILVGLVFIALFFQYRSGVRFVEASDYINGTFDIGGWIAYASAAFSVGKFLIPTNLYNLIVQMSFIAAIAYGIVFVLLIGEIDLSVSYVSAIAAAVVVIAMTEGRGIPIGFSFEEGALVVTQTILLSWWQALILALFVTTLIGYVQGWIINVLSVPAFIVTLAGFLVWSGMVLILLGRGGTIRMSDPMINNIANYFLTDMQGWIILGVVVAIYAYLEVSNFLYRQSHNLATKPMGVIVLQVIGVAIGLGLVVWIANNSDTPAQDRGLPFVGIILIVFLGVLSFVANRTTFGRYVYAVGGNIEAARRAGINVVRIRISVFAIAGFMAGVGGIILLSRLRSISTEAGGGDLLLNSIAAAVIGGTSLFGGRGKVSSALLGALVIGSLANGMGLLGWSAGLQSVVTGIVLVLAVLLDSLSRQAQRRAGLA